MITTSSTPRIRRPLLAVLVTLFAWTLAPGLAYGEIEREQLSNAEPTNLVNVTPIRIERDVEPGERATEQVAVFNDSASAIRMRATPINLGPPNDPAALVDAVYGDAEFGARDWITIEATNEVIQPFEKLTFDVYIDAPENAPVGSSYAGIEFNFLTVGEAASEQDANQVGVRVVSVLQLLLNVPGAVVNELELVSARTTDAFRLGGGEFASFEVRYRNRGTVTDHVNGTVRVRSLLGNTVAKLDMPEKLVLRGATRSDRIVWNDLPSFGIFRATVELTGDDGVKIERDLQTIYLLPPWWVIALIAAAILLPPVWIWWRRRQEWQLYLEDDDELDDARLMD